MALWTVIPVKPFEEAKSRLAPDLSPMERADLASWLFKRTLAVTLNFAASQPVLVVTRSQEVIDLARIAGAQTLREGINTDLNAALTSAASYAVDEGASSVLTVATDLPFLEAGNLRMMVDIHSDHCAIAPDRWFKGTNALLWRGKSRPPYAFGFNSYADHLAAIEARGFIPQIVLNRGLSFDVDHMDDLRLWSETRCQSTRTGIRSPDLSVGLSRYDVDYLPN